MHDKNMPIKDKQIDLLYQQAIEPFEPSESLDKRIQALAKEQAKQRKQQSRYYLWSATHWLAKAASFASISIIGWWLWSETAIKPVEMQTYIDSTMPSQTEKMFEVQPVDLLSAKSAQKMIIKSQQQVVKLSKKESDQERVSLQQMSFSARCISRSLASYNIESLAKLSTPENTIHKLNADYKLAITQTIHWQGERWKLYKNNTLWVLKPLTDNSHNTYLFILPEVFIEDCLVTIKEMKIRKRGG